MSGPLDVAPDLPVPDTADDDREARRGHAHHKRFAVAAGQHALLIGAALLFTIPFYWMVISAFKTNAGIFARPIDWFPDFSDFSTFRAALDYEGFDYPRLLWNSTYYTGLTTIGTVLSSAVVGYGFARFRFPGRGVLFSITVATLIIPGIVTFIPTFVLFKELGLLGTYAPLIAPAFFGNAFYIFMLRQFFLGLPAELPDAARMDGANEWRIFWQIMLPLVRPALIVVAVFTMLATWNDFFGPLIYLSSPDKYPLSLGLFTFQAQRTTEWAMLMAASVLTTLPVIVLFALSQRYFLGGIKTTGIVR